MRAALGGRVQVGLVHRSFGVDLDDLRLGRDSAVGGASVGEDDVGRCGFQAYDVISRVARVEAVVVPDRLSRFQSLHTPVEVVGRILPRRGEIVAVGVALVDERDVARVFVRTGSP